MTRVGPALLGGRRREAGGGGRSRGRIPSRRSERTWNERRRPGPWPGGGHSVAPVAGAQAAAREPEDALQSLRVLQPRGRESLHAPALRQAGRQHGLQPRRLRGSVQGKVGGGHSPLQSERKRPVTRCPPAPEGARPPASLSPRLRAHGGRGRPSCRTLGHGVRRAHCRVHVHWGLVNNASVRRPAPVPNSACGL